MKKIILILLSVLSCTYGLAEPSKQKDHSQITKMTDDELNNRLNKLNENYELQMQLLLEGLDQTRHVNAVQNEKACLILQNFINEFYGYLDQYRPMFETEIKNYNREQFVAAVDQLRNFKIAKSVGVKCQFK